MSQSEQGNSLAQYSIRAVLVLTALTAAGIAAWKTFIWKPPTHQISHYEKAPMYRGTSATIGPNQIRIRVVARNDRDGGIKLESGRGNKINGQVANQQLMIDSAPWLDVVDISLSPGRNLIDPIEIRVFDHATREFLNVDRPRCGWRYDERVNSVQLYGLGQELPEQIDLWFRAHSYRADDEVLTLKPTPGASIKIADGDDSTTVQINRVQKGYLGWSSVDGFLPVAGDQHQTCAIELGWANESPSKQLKYQVTAITKNSERLFGDRFHKFSGSGKKPIDFHCGLDEIFAIEVRPYGGSHVFFFDGLQLPPVSRSTRRTQFADPPTAVIKVGERPSQLGPYAAPTGMSTLTQPTVIKEFRPLDVRLLVADGRVYNGSGGGSNFVELRSNPMGPQDLGKSFSRALATHGLTDPPFSFRTRMTGQTTWMPDSSLNQRGGFRANSATRHVSAKTFQTPLKDIDAIEVQLLPVSGN